MKETNVEVKGGRVKEQRKWSLTATHSDSLRIIPVKVGIESNALTRVEISREGN